MQQARCVLLAWRKHPPNTSRIEWDSHLVINVFAWAKIHFSMLFLLNLFSEFESLYKLHKTNNKCFLIRAMEQIFSFGERWNVPFISSLTSWNICTIALINIRYLHTIYLLKQQGSRFYYLPLILWIFDPYDQSYWYPTTQVKGNDGIKTAGFLLLLNLLKTT